MLETMHNCARHISDSDIRQIESELNLSLPLSYKRFLARFNGGLPVPDAFPIAGFPRNPYGIIQVFFGIDRDVESSNLIWNYNVFRIDNPHHLFPIACTPNDDVICLSLSGDDEGAVLFWDYYVEQGTPPNKRLHIIAPDFDAFIASLFRAPESRQ